MTLADYMTLTITSQAVPSLANLAPFDRMYSRLLVVCKQTQHLFGVTGALAEQPTLHNR